MEANAVISKLKSSAYKFTEAGKLRSALKKMPEELREDLVSRLRCELGKSSNADIATPLREVISDFRYS
jgi:hypothetical protein